MSSYDRSITVFSPDGQLLQVEYAMEAVKKGSAVIGIRAKDAVILAVEKRAAAKLQVDRTLQKIVRIDEHISLAFSGLSADARVLIDKARLECQSYRLTAEDAPSVEYIARTVGSIQQKYTQRGGVRPFGIFSIIAGVGNDGVPQLWSVDPSGIYFAWKAHAVGRHANTLFEMLEEQYTEGCTEEEAVRLAVTVLLEIVESGSKSIQIGIMRKGVPMENVSESDIEALVKSIEEEKNAEGNRQSSA